MKRHVATMLLNLAKTKCQKKKKQIYEVVNLVYRRLIFGQCSITLYFQPRHIPQQYLRIAIRHYI